MTHWYVRPKGVGIETKDGTSWLTAWEALDNVVWGDLGVQAGDTLWVCGDKRKYGSGPTNEKLTIGASGTEGNPITIRGDNINAPDANARADDTTCIGSFYACYPPGTSWVEADETYHVYSLADAGGWTNVTLDANNNIIYQKVEANAAGPPTYSLMTPGTIYYDTGGTSYVRAYGDVDPTTLRLYSIMADTVFYINSYDYIIIKNFPLVYGNVLLYAACNNVIDNCTFTQGIWGIKLRARSDSNLIKNNTIYKCADGIYMNFVEGGTGNPGINNIFEYNIIYDIRNGPDRQNTSGDNEIIGVQSGTGNIFRYNHLYDGKVGLSMYSGYAEEMSFEMYGNHIHDCFRLAVAPEAENQVTAGFGHGITVVLSEGALGDGFVNQNFSSKIYDNIIYNTENAAISHHWPKGTGTHTVSILNNTIRYSQMGMYLSAPLGRTPAYKLKNNIISDLHDYENGLANLMIMYHDYSGTNDLDIDYNDYYYPGITYPFFFNSAWDYEDACDLATWKTACQSPNTGNETHSIITDPAFINASGLYNVATDYKINSTSPCAATGVDVGLDTDYAGNTWADPPSMGAYESMYKDFVARVKASMIAQGA